MIHHKGFVRDLSELDNLINELEGTYKGFKMITVLSISSGYILYYTLTSVSEGEGK